VNPIPPPRPAPAGRRCGGCAARVDLQPDHEEEQRHQPVVDQVAQVQGQGPAADLHGQLGSPQGLVSRPPRRVRRPQGHAGGREQDQDAGGLGVRNSRRGTARRRATGLGPALQEPSRADDVSARGPPRSAGTSCLPTRLPAHQPPLHPSTSAGAGGGGRDPPPPALPYSLMASTRMVVTTRIASTAHTGP
jgi:hypothetical protein